MLNKNYQTIIFKLSTKMYETLWIRWL